MGQFGLLMLPHYSFSLYNFCYQNYNVILYIICFNMVYTILLFCKLEEHLDDLIGGLLASEAFCLRLN